MWSHKLRTFLTMFGIAWGIVSIVLMVAAGEGLRKGQEDQTQDARQRHHDRLPRPCQLAGGRNGRGRSGALGGSGMPAFQTESPDCEYVVPELEQDTVRTHSNYNSAAFPVTGSLPPFGYLRSLDVGTWAFLQLGGYGRRPPRCLSRNRCRQATVSRTGRRSGQKPSISTKFPTR